VRDKTIGVIFIDDDDDHDEIRETYSIFQHNLTKQNEYDCGSIFSIKYEVKRFPCKIFSRVKSHLFIINAFFFFILSPYF